MDISKLKDSIPAEQFSELESHIKALTNQRDEARAESISGRKTLKAEVEKLRSIKDTLYDKLGIEDDANLDDLQIPTKGAEVEAVKQYERKVKKLEQELSTAKTALSDLDGKYRGSVLDTQLTKAISTHDFVDTDLVADYVKSRVKFEEGEVRFVDGEKSLTVDEAVKYLATTKPHLLKAQGQGGSGFNPTSTSGKVKAFNEMTLTERTELYKRDPAAYQAAKAAA